MQFLNPKPYGRIGNKSFRIAVTAHLLLFLSVAALMFSAQSKPAEASHGRIAIVSPISASVWNAQCYYPNTIWIPCGSGGTHAGSPTPFDIGDGNSGHAAYFQIDYLPASIAGGYMQAFNVWTGCANLTGTQFSGHRVQIEWDFWDTSGNYITWAHAVYLHVDWEQWPINQGWAATWNNPNSWAPRHAFPHFNLNNATSGGYLFAYVAGLGSAVPASCSTNEHIHMEGNIYSDYEYGRYYLESVTGRWSNIFYYHQPGIAGTHP